MLELIECVPDHAKMPVAELNVGKLSEIALEKNYAGVLGHYFLLNGRLVQKHLEAGQKVGTGYPDSRNCMSRELNRGVNWLFQMMPGGLSKSEKQCSLKMDKFSFLTFLNSGDSKYHRYFWS